MESSLYQEAEPDKTQELKKNMFLDFGSGSSTKQQKYASLLTSPDMNMLKMASPEIEKMLFASNSLSVLQTPTPTQFIYPKYVTDEQEAYARGFVEALAQLQNGSMAGQPGAQMMPNAAGTSGMQDVKQQAELPAASSSEDQPTYSTLLPLSSTASTMSTSNAATTLASMSSNMGIPAPNMSGMPPKRPFQFAPSPLVTPKQPLPTAMPSSSSLPSTSADMTLSINVKDEPPYSAPNSSSADHAAPTNSSQVSPSPSSSRMTDSPGALSPGSVNMDDNVSMNLADQEAMKVERKRARNRIAARKCRTRKLERISRLEEKVAELKNRNNDLLQHATSLNEQVAQLKQQIMDHMKTGCQIILPNGQQQS